MKNHFTGFFFLLLALSFSVLYAGCQESAPPSSPPQPVITEGCNRNRSLIQDQDGNYSDWIELHNPGDQDILLEGYALSDNEKVPKKWVFPEGTMLKSGEYLLIFCSGRSESSGGELHTSFGLSRSGESVILTSPAGVIVSSLSLPELPPNYSCSSDPDSPDSLLFYRTPTPGAANGSDGAKTPEELTLKDYDLVINEYSNSNSYGFYDRDGDCPTWAEIRNTGTEVIDLEGFFLSDDAFNLNKWAFPEGLTIEPGMCQLIFLSGKNRFSQGELHADFRLGKNDTHLILSSPDEKVLDQVELVPLEGNASLGRLPEEPETWSYFHQPTPGSENLTPAYETLEDSLSLPAREVWINEVSAVSDRSLSLYYKDWIELYNGSDHSVDLTGYGLSNSNDDFFKYVFPDTVLDPGEFLVLWADGSEIPDGEDYQVPFSISPIGESLYLTTPEGRLSDSFDTGRQKNGITSGRGPGPEDRRLFFTECTRGEENAAGFSGYTALAQFSPDNLYLPSGETVTISGTGEIHYTTDGSEPTADSPVYTGPIPIESNTTIRALCLEDGRICGGTSSHSYIVDDPHKIAVVCVSAEPWRLFDYYSGIYETGPYASPEFPYFGANYWGDTEVPIQFEFYEPDGSPGIAFDAGIRIFGQFSRAVPQKSMSVHLREGYGESKVYYPFFPDSGITEYHDLLLRSSGQDWNTSKLRDALTQQLTKDCMDLDSMDYRPVALYINGEYWGLYNLRDKVNEQYLHTHRGVDPDNLDIIRSDTFAVAGDMDAYYDMMNFVAYSDMSDPDNYAYLRSIVDVDQVIDYWITESFFGNTDTGNIKMYRERTPDSKFRMILYDLDWCLTPSTYDWNHIREVLAPGGHGAGNGFPTTLLRGIVASQEGEQAFIQRYAHHLNTTFSPERTGKILREMADVIRDEIPRQWDRWGAPSPDGWESEIDFLESAMIERREQSISDLQDYFGIDQDDMNQLFPDG